MGILVANVIGLWTECSVNGHARPMAMQVTMQCNEKSQSVPHYTKKEEVCAPGWGLSDLLCNMPGKGYRSAGSAD